MTLLANLDRLRKERWERGMLHYRQPGEPFKGCPRSEMLEELMDSLNYLDEAVRQCVISPEAASVIDDCLRRSVMALEVDAQHLRLTQVAI
jgi:hypothetical protein